MTTVYALYLEADRISFFLFFGARKCIFYFSAFYFSTEKDIRIFVFFSFFFDTKMAVTKQKKQKFSTLTEAMHSGQNSSHLQSHTAAVYIVTRSA